MKKLNNNTSINSPSGIDQTDMDVMKLLLQDHTNKQISYALKVPLSTIQRRVRNLYENQFLILKVTLNYEKIGLKRGLIHIYLSDGNIDDIVEKLSNMDGIVSIQVHIENSDILAGVVYREGSDLLRTISDIKKIDSIERIV